MTVMAVNEPRLNIQQHTLDIANHSLLEPQILKLAITSSLTLFIMSRITLSSLLDVNITIMHVSSHAVSCYEHLMN